ncbi:adhesion G-protein coupled receptor G6 isoform X11 [Nothobranchius furzeri]|uniref:Adhesion G-protein coupled receptor G6 n=1 Tax=Nothobranchius furzeri TaxID=105023 RepID=A0A1A8A8M9_NOTFU|nr:transcript variant X5 [Nothobranchius furzeri]
MMDFYSEGVGGRWRLHPVFWIVLFWISLHRTALGCSSTNCNVVLMEVQGEFTSPCYPQKYPNWQNCKWTIQAPAGFVIELSFLDFEVEEAQGCIYDRVVVNTGSTEVKFCGLTARGLTLNSTGNVMEVSFTSDFSIQKKGFKVSFQHVAVALRNQKVKISDGNGQVIRVSSSVSIPALRELTVCFEVERTAYNQREWLFSYYDTSSNVALSFGSSQTGMKMVVDQVVCPVQSIVSAADFTSTMKPFCLLWRSSSGLVEVFFNRASVSISCSSSTGHTVPAGGVFQLGGQQSFSGNMYNLRLWDRAMTLQELDALTCDTAGNVIDWDNSNWTIPSSLAQTNNTLSCSMNQLTPPGAGAPDGLFFGVFMLVRSPLSQQEVERAVALGLNESLRGWSFSLEDFRVYSGKPTGNATSFSCQFLLLITNESLDGAFIMDQLSTRMQLVGAGPQVQSSGLSVHLAGNCKEENALDYLWPETRPRTTQYLPCFPNKDQRASRSCLIKLEDYSSVWSPADLTNCTVTAENAAIVAEQLINFTNSNLTKEKVSQAVTKVRELVSLETIDTAMAKTVVHIISNVMSNVNVTSEMPLVNKRALKAVERLAQKVTFEGPSINITSKHLALGILALNTSNFNGTSFSAFLPPNSSAPQIGFELTANALAQVTLPPSLLSGVVMSEIERSSLSRINFRFFSSTNLFEKRQKDSFLNSYVVASSAGNFSIKDLRDPVKIEISHLTKQVSSGRKCVFWDFSLNGGNGSWNERGCRVAEGTSSKTVCLCDHLTHFGILMDVSQASSRIDSENKKVLTFLSYIGCGVSAVCSAATLLTYVAFEQLRRDYPSKILMNLSTSLLSLNMVFLLDGWLASLDNTQVCLSVAVLLHYFLLTSFTWMGLESVHMYIALVKVFNTYIRRYILKFCIIGWGLPAVLVGIIVTVNKNFYGVLRDGGDPSAKICWIRDASVFYSTCVGYFCLVFLLNVAMFFVVMMQICGRNGKRSNRTLREEVLRNLRSVVSLTFLLGMTWGFALFAWGPVYLAFTYLFTIFNSLQGLFIFIFHCALKENVQKQWRRSLCCGPYRLSDNSDWSKTATNNTKKVSSDNLALSSSSFGSGTFNWTAKAKATLTPFSKRHKNSGKCFSGQSGLVCTSSSSSSDAEPNSSSSSSILPVSQMIDKVKGYCSTRTDNFYKNIIMSDSFVNCTRL